MNSKMRMNIVLEGGKADQIPIALIIDETYLARVSNTDLRYLRFGNSADRIAMQKQFWNTHKKNDMIICWDGVDRAVGRIRRCL